MVGGGDRQGFLGTKKRLQEEEGGIPDHPTPSVWRGVRTPASPSLRSHKTLGPGPNGSELLNKSQGEGSCPGFRGMIFKDDLVKKASLTTLSYYLLFLW